MKYKLFGTQTGLPASEVILGAASLGQRRGYGAAIEDIPGILGAYANAGGNFIDMADQYQFGEAEEIVGRFIASNRQDFIICTKYTLSSEKAAAPGNMGNHRKAMRQAVEGSLQRLKTDYIDLYMPHFDDGLTPIEEIARGLEDLTKSGKVLYTGLANFPAWKAAAIAGSIRLNALQMEYNLLQRAAERELIGMANYYGLGKMFYSPLAGGLLTGKYRKGDTGRLTISAPGTYQENAVTSAIIDELEAIGSEIRATPGQVALAWTLTKGAFSIIGARTLNQIQDGLRALEVKLGPDHIMRLDQVSSIDMGYPHDLLKTVQKYNS